MHGEAWPDGPDLKSNADSGATGAQDASLESASLESGGTKQRAHDAARTLRAQEIIERVEAWPGGPDLKSRAGSGGTRSPRCQLGERYRGERQGVAAGNRSPRRQLGERHCGELKDVAAGPLGRSQVACRGGYITVHGEAWPDGPDLKSNADSGATGAQDASLESASLESGGTKQRAHVAARTLRAEEITERVEAWPGGPDLKSRAGTARNTSLESAIVES